MDTSNVTCPNCHTSFPLTEAIEQPIVDRLKVQLEGELGKKAAAREAEATIRLKGVEEKEKALAAQAEKLRREKSDADEAFERRVGFTATCRASSGRVCQPSKHSNLAQSPSCPRLLTMASPELHSS